MVTAIPDSLAQPTDWSKQTPPLPGEFLIPGTNSVLYIDQDTETGSLHLHAEGRTYMIRASSTAETIYGDELAVVSEAMFERKLLRQVHTARGSWIEEYHWDDANHLSVVDGVRMIYDGAGRVVGCDSPAGSWRYGYAGEQLVVIDSPTASRTITTGERGRPVRMRDQDGAHDLRYDADGRRRDIPALPALIYHRDSDGRLWTVTSPQGRVLMTYIWYGFACLGRIDGAPGEALTAVFSLDPSNTPVRLITPAGMTRLWRDAFGESLLQIPDVPGLFGGAIYDGYVHYRSRTLDPRVGAFNAPDPLDGTLNDPRRAQGFRGTVLVERPSIPYAVCQYDPVNRADPTGEFSGVGHLVWLLMSTLTWSSMNNIIGIFGMDWIANLWGSLFTWNGEFFSSEFVTSQNSFGIRRAGMMESFNKNNAWTYQHIVWASGRFFNYLSFARDFVPSSAFRPKLYATLLRCVPSHGDPFVIQGGRFPSWSEPSRDDFLKRTFGRPTVSTQIPPMGWTRNGGTAEPVIPGSSMPWFPNGGLHLDSVRFDVPCPQDATLTEVEMMGSVATGTKQNRASLRLSETGLGLTTDQYLLLSDASNNLAVAQVQATSEESGATTVYLHSELTGFATDNLRMRGLSNPDPAENLNHDPALPAAYLSVVGSARNYRQDDILRLKQGANEVGSVSVSRLEAKLSINAPITGLSSPITINIAQPIDPPRQAKLVADVNNLDLQGTITPPLIDGALVLISDQTDSTKLAVVLTRVSGNTWHADQPLQPLFGAAGATVKWRRMNTGMVIGSVVGTLAADATLTYTPITVRTAPTADFVRVADNSGNQVVRQVTGRVYDALVLPSLPGITSNPYSAERFTIQNPDKRNLSLSRSISLVLNPALPADATALLLYQFGTPTLTPSAVPLNGGTVGASGNTLTYTAAPATSTTPTAAAPHPLQVIGINTGAAALTPAVVTGLTLSITLDRALEAPFNAPVPDLRIVRLAESGADYEANLISASNASPVIVTVKPSAKSGTAPRASIAVQMPRFQAGQIVRVSTATLADVRLFRVKSVEGTTLTLEADASFPVGIATGADLLVTRMDVSTPATPINGTPWAGIDGLNSDAQHFRFSVWSPDAIQKSQPVAIATSDKSFPAVVASTDSLVIGFVPTTTVAAGSYDIETPAATHTGAAGRMTRNGSAISVERVDLADGDGLIIAVPLKDSARSTTGKLSSGTTRVPDDVDTRELNRLEAIKTHELTHTLQSALWGPLLLFPFPLFILELPIDLASDAELPQFSQFVPAHVIADGDNRFIQIPDTHGIAFAKDNLVQVAWNSPQGSTEVTGSGRLHSMKLGVSRPTNEFLIMDSVQTIPAGVTELQIRRGISDNAEDWGMFLSIAKLLTPGGLLKWAGTAELGGLWWLIAHGFYALGEKISGSKTFPVTIEGTGADAGKLLRPSSEDGRTKLLSAQTLLVKAGDSTVVQAVERVENGVIRLRVACPFTTDVRAAPYELGTPDDSWDWRHYYPASVPDVSRPTAIRVDSVGTDRLNLSVFDRVVCKAGRDSADRIVVAIGADNLVELNEPPPTATDARTFRIASTGVADPATQNAKADLPNYLIDQMGLDWLKYVFDPYGTLTTRARAERGSWQDVVLRSIRYLLSTESWSLLGFFWSKFFLDRVLAQASGEDYLSPMEQQASSASGDLYSSLGRLRGFADHKVVGDIGRYWFMTVGRERTLISSGLSDAPGVHFRDIPRIIPAVDAPTVASTDPQPNGNAIITAGHADPALDVPDVFYGRSRFTPNDKGTNSPDGFAPSNIGWIPTTAELELATGMYVAFSRPGKHRVTVANGAADSDDRVAQEKGKAELFFDITVDPAEVKIMGDDVAEGSTITLVQTQSITVSVQPDGSRRYAATLLRPQNGTVLRTPDVNNNLTIAAQRANGSEAVEISRVYKFVPDSSKPPGHFDGDVFPHGVHLPTDIHIPVRSFTLAVTDVLKLRSALDVDPAHEIASLSKGTEAFIIVPTSVGPSGLSVASATEVASGNPVASLATLAAFSPAARDLPADLRAKLGVAARAFRVRVDPAVVIPGAVNVRLTVEAGAAAPFATLKVEFTLQP